jgi:hypothetical protein
MSRSGKTEALRALAALWSPYRIVMKTIGIAALISDVAKTNAAFKNSFEEERALAPKHLGLSLGLFSGEAREVIQMARRLDAEALQPLIQKGEALVRFESTALAEVPSILSAAQEEGLSALSGLELPSEMPSERYVSQSQEFLRKIDSAIEEARRSKVKEDEFVQAYGYSTFALKVALLRGLPFPQDFLTVSHGGDSFVLVVRDTRYQGVVRAVVTIHQDRKMMSVDELDAGSIWKGKGVVGVFARNLFEVAAHMGMREVALGGGKSDGARFWSLIGGVLADRPIRWDRDMLGFPEGAPYYGLESAVEGIRLKWRYLQERYNGDKQIREHMAHYHARIESLESSTASDLVRAIAADRTLVQGRDGPIPFGRFFFAETKLRFSYSFDLSKAETWRLIYTYCRNTSERRRASVGAEPC